ncbi:hypothetical protein [Acinetobacter towneri]|uniref:hypothetical protein n=1 Tax=Acinetobacter towneri TaxID=202956 RepID=UPI003A885A98
MTIHLELDIAPRLEADIYNLYIEARNLRGQDGEQLCIQKFTEKLLAYSDACQRLMHLDCNVELSFWLTCFKQAYLTVFNKNEWHYYQDDRLDSKRLPLVVKELLCSFNTATFVNWMNHVNERQRKNIDKVERLYQAMNEICINPRDVCFNFGFQSVVNPYLCLETFSKMVKQFEKRLDHLEWYRYQVCFALRYIHREERIPRYVVTLCLSFDHHYFEQISVEQIELDLARLWREVTEQKGISLDKPDLLMQHRIQALPLQASETNSPETAGAEFCLLNHLLELPQGGSIVNDEKKALCVTYLGFKSMSVIKRTPMA